METPFVAIWMITYNHSNFISQAVEGIVMQKANFKYKLYIGEDCSTDDTRNICIELSKKYSDKIELFLNDKNDLLKNSNTIYSACSNSGAKYMAMCEGDDYWTDPYKLQKQVDFLEENPDYSMCFHNAKVIYQDGSKPPVYFNDANQKETLYFSDLAERWQIATASMVYRTEFFSRPRWTDKIYNGDMALQFLLIDRGPFKFIDNVMCVYRRHNSGISNVAVTPQINNIKSILQLLEFLNEHLEYRHNEPIKKLEAHLHKALPKVKFANAFPLVMKLRGKTKSFLSFLANKI